MKKRLVYLANARIPSERAHGAQIAHMCSAFISVGWEVELVVPTRKGVLPTSLKEHYDLPHDVSVTRLNVPDLVSYGPLGYFITTFLFARAVHTHVLQSKPDIVYARDAALLYGLPQTISTVYEVHEPRYRYWAKQVLKRALLVVALSEGVRDALPSTSRKVLVAHDAIPNAWVPVSCDVASAREELGISAKQVALYIGSVGPGKGVETLCEAAGYLKDIAVVVVGPGAEKLKGQYPNVHFVGPHPYGRLPHVQCAGDVLVIPNSMGTDNTSTYTSPLKLFAHLISGVPIVVSDVPVLRNIVSDTEVHFVAPDDPKALAVGIMEAVGDRDRIEAARALGMKYTWEARARAITEAL